ncbi:hypothetical protein SFRURICE_016864 [Spodoptera frugiperda]|nr:hypothetical protein SFRURICE_016864 [Spodoptera frugiperda]
MFFFLERCVLWTRAMDGFPTIDTSHTRAAHISCTATQLMPYKVIRLLPQISDLFLKPETYFLDHFKTLFSEGMKTVNDFSRFGRAETECQTLTD